jgi:hypothetical protein
VKVMRGFRILGKPEVIRSARKVRIIGEFGAPNERRCRMYGPPCECKGKVSNEGKSASMYSAFRWGVSPGLDEIRRVPVLRKRAGLVRAV